MKKLLLGLVIFGAFAVAAVVLGRGASQQDPLAGVEAMRVVRRDIESVVTATGVIKPSIGAEVRVGSRISGVVRRLFVRVGDTVEKGQILAELDPEELTSRHAQASAERELSRANLRYAQADLQRQRELSAARLIAPNALELAERTFAVAEQELRAAEASLAFAATQLGYTRIHAPIAGVVSSISTQEGETVAASLAAPTFVTLLDLDRLEVWAYVDETDIGRISVGQKARFTVDTYPNHAFEGRITTVYPQAEIRDNVVNYVTVVRFDPPRDRVLRPEMTTTVRITREARGDVLAVPRRAMRREGGRQFVLCRRGATVERCPVKTGSRDESFWEITKGLREGDEVLLGDPGRSGPTEREPS